MFIVSYKTDRGDYDSVGTNNRVVVRLKTLRGAVNRARKMCFKNREFKIEHINSNGDLSNILFEGK